MTFDEQLRRIEKYSSTQHDDGDGEKRPDHRRVIPPYKPLHRAPPPTKPSAYSAVSPWTTAVVPDLHAPRQQKKAWGTSLGIIKDRKPNAIVIMGDFGDFESISHHPKNRPDLVKFRADCDETNRALDSVQDASPGSEVYYIEGNHEYRAVKYINAFPHLDGLLSVPEKLYILPPGSHKPIPPSPSLVPDYRTSRVNVNLRGITWIPFRNYLRRAWVAPWGCGYMHSAKGNGSWAGGGKYHAAYHADNIGPVSGCRLIVYGHHHTFQHFRNAAGYEAYCAGFLGDFDGDEPAFDYAGGPSSWVTGMLFQEFKGPLAHTEQIYITNGRALCRGKLYG